MTAVAAPESKLTPAAVPVIPSTDAKVAVERSQIDSAAAGPVLIFFTTSIAWLLVASFLGFITSMKLHSPGFLADLPFLTYGRVAPAYNLALTYGWASLVGMGVSIWMMSRLCRVPLRYPGVLVLGAVFWNLGLVLGIGSVLAGKNTGIPGMEIPFGAAALMFIGYLLIGLWGAILYKFRRNAPVYISVWYLLGAFFWFPWFFGVAHIAVTMPQVQGVVQSVIAAWFSQNLSLLWLTPIGLAAAYYLIPKVVNRPIYSYNLASIGFWTFALFGGLTGMTRLSGGPVPAWFVTVGIAANIMMIVPIVTVLTNFIFTMHGQTHMVYYSPTIRFTFFGVIAFAISCFVGVLASLRGFDSIVHFTQFQAAQQHLVIYAFFSMVMFGAIYYITPRLVGCEWLSSSLIKMHFLGAAYGGATIIAMMAFSGLSAGLTMIDPDATFSQVIQIGQVYFAGSSLAYVFIIFAHLFFALHFLLMLLRIGQPGGEPTLFANPGQETH
ncbi:MAG: hypothetical protein JWL90_1669 [Chthoniobacteraceae bacterium]|nr:hypothetical protein [Chthoniobacteraceae bacterium]